MINHRLKSIELFLTLSSVTTINIAATQTVEVIEDNHRKQDRAIVNQ